MNPILRAQWAFYEILMKNLSFLTQMFMENKFWSSSSYKTTLKKYILI